MKVGVPTNSQDTAVMFCVPKLNPVLLFQTAICITAGFNRRKLTTAQYCLSNVPAVVAISK